MQERMQAAEANDRKVERRQVEIERATDEEARRMQQAMPSAPVAQPRAEGWQERKNREDVATSAASITRNGGRLDEQAEAERAALRREEARKAAAAAAVAEANTISTITNCEGLTCTDTSGKIYIRNGGFLSRFDGRVCTALGNQVRCD